jgi:hypothetical protein
MARLTIQNSTDWSTADIRRAIRAAEAHFGLKWSRKVYVKNTKGGAHGRAAYPVDRRTLGRLERGYKGKCEGQYVKLYLPRTPPSDLERFRLDFLWLVLHEVAHNAGLSHHDMGIASPLYRVFGAAEAPHDMKDLTIRWEKAQPLTEEQRVERRSTSVSKRAAKVDADLARWERRLKLAKTKVSKLLAKQRYYQKKLTAAPAEEAAALPLAAKESP